jgi:hypothetical protein
MAVQLTRREWAKCMAAGALGVCQSGWLASLAADAANHPQRKRACILLWMNGGPSQTDTFDLKPGHPNGGQFREISTSVPGIRIGEHLPKLARNMDDMVLVRSMSTREGDHGRATFYMRTGYLPQGAVQYPTLGSLISKELINEETALPNFVSIAPFRQFNLQAYGPGFLGARFAPLIVGENRQGQFVDNYQQNLRVPDLLPASDVPREQADARIGLLEGMEREFVARHPGLAPQSHRTAYARAVRLMRTAAREAFNLDQEPARLRDSYGRNTFGQGCLLARRLVERGVPFIEVNLGAIPQNGAGWDTHANNFDNVRLLCQVLDPAWAALMEDLRDRGLLESTLIVWMGEFGRTPRINNNRGRDHFPNAWTTVLAGGGLRGGRVVGATSRDGTTVEADHPVSVPDLLSTVCRALGIDPTKQNMSNVQRPIRIVDIAARPIREVLAS